MASQYHDLITSCGIENPLEKNSCCGTTKNKQSCKLRVTLISRKEARTKLLALDPQDRALKSKLQDIAKLLLCSRWHQGQAKDVAEGWHTVHSNYYRPRQGRLENSIDLTDASATTPANSETATREDPVDLTPTLVNSSSRTHEVSADELLEQLAPFKVSDERLATVTLQHVTGRVTRIRLRSLQPGDDDVNCRICLNNTPDESSQERVYLACGRCLHKVHWGCMVEWARGGTNTEVSCILCRNIGGPFDGFYRSSTVARTMDAVMSPIPTSGPGPRHTGATDSEISESHVQSSAQMANPPPPYNRLSQPSNSEMRPLESAAITPPPVRRSARDRHPPERYGYRSY